MKSVKEDFNNFCFFSTIYLPHGFWVFLLLQEEPGEDNMVLIVELNP